MNLIDRDMLISLLETKIKTPRSTMEINKLISMIEALPEEQPERVANVFIDTKGIADLIRNEINRVVLIDDLEDLSEPATCKLCGKELEDCLECERW